MPVVQRLGVHAFTAEGWSSIPGWGTKTPQAVQCRESGLGESGKNHTAQPRWKQGPQHSCPGVCEPSRGLGEGSSRSNDPSGADSRFHALRLFSPPLLASSPLSTSCALASQLMTLTLTSWRRLRRPPPPSGLPPEAQPTSPSSQVSPVRATPSLWSASLLPSWPLPCPHSPDSGSPTPFHASWLLLLHRGSGSPVSTLHLS